MAEITKENVKNAYYKASSWTDVVKDAKFAHGKLKLGVKEKSGKVYFFSVRDFSKETLQGLLKAYVKENPDNIVKTEKMSHEYYATTVEMLLSADRINTKRAAESFNTVAEYFGWNADFNELSVDDKADASHLFKYAERHGLLDPSRTNYISDDVVRAIWKTAYADKQAARQLLSGRTLITTFNKNLKEMQSQRDAGTTSTKPETDKNKFTKNRKNKKLTKKQVNEVLEAFDATEVVDEMNSKLDIEPEDKDETDDLGLFK